MKIPIPSRHRRLQLTLGIRATRPGAIGLVAYDPHMPHTDYLRRKITFRDTSLKPAGNPYRELRLSLPISPEDLVLEVYNKHTRTDEGFDLSRMELQELPPAAVWASAERHRFMAFAIRFAQMAGYAKAGFYHAPDHEFLIHYLPTLTDEQGQELITPARIHRHMPRVQLSQKLFRPLTIPVRVAILAHEGCHFFLNTRSEQQADLCGLHYYLDYGFPTIEAVYAATQVFRQHPASIGKPHVDRTAAIMDFIHRYKKNPNLQHAS